MNFYSVSDRPDCNVFTVRLHVGPPNATHSRPLSMSQMSVRLYVKRVNALTERKKIVPSFLYRMKDHSS